MKIPKIYQMYEKDDFREIRFRWKQLLTGKELKNTEEGRKS